jgi:hypothetical protein
MIRRLLTAVGLAALALGLLAPPAAAETVVAEDPAGDGRGLADIRAIRLSQAGDYVLMQIRTARGVDLDTAPTWTTTGSASVLRFNLDTGGDGAIDRVVRLEPAEGGPHVVVEAIAQSPTPRIPCTFLSQPEPTIIRIKVHQACVGEPAQVRAFARYFYDAGGDGTVESSDRARNVGYTPFLPIFN